MESITETRGSFNIGMLLMVVALLVLSATLVVGGVMGYWKSRAVVGRLPAVVALVGGGAIISTLALGGAELLPETALWTLLLFELGILTILFWVWMLVDCAIKEPSEGNDKLVWVLIILFTHVLGAALYLFVRRPRRLAAE